MRPALLSLLLLAGCASDEPWTFGISRTVYDSDLEVCAPSSPPQAEAAVVILLLPLALDLLLLPVAVPHDLIVHGGL